VDEGLLRWTSTIGEVLGAGLPELHAGWKEVTLADLLRHLSGVPGKPPPEMWQAAWSCKGPASECRAQFIAKILAQAPQRQRGTFEYSNQGYAIAGRMCEVVAKATWEELVRRRVCEPLGISSLGFGVPSAREAERSPKGHGPTGALLDIDNPNAIAPAGTMHMTISDWARFAAFHAATKPDPRMRMSEASFAELHTSPKDAPQPVAMGWFPAERSWGRGTVLSHAGSNNSWFCVAWVAPARRFAVLVTCNRGGDLASSACDRVVGEAIRWFDSFEAAKKPSAPATKESEAIRVGS
jgi:CubicO group peptidase (beta-lactamase class C family)